MKQLTAFIFLLLIVTCTPFTVIYSTPSADETDWPMWRYDQHRSASSSHELSGDLSLHWVREFPAPQRAWPRQMDDYEKLAFDKSYEPVAADGMLFVPSMVNDKVSAYSTETGEELWHYYADGPVRLAPLYHDGKLYFVSDDGHLYCLNAGNGEEIWSFRAAPNNRIVLGNRRLISLWPARGGPVIKDGTLYFSAGLWPHEGVYIYALDAETAEVQWVNSGSQSDLIVDSKRYYSFGGVVPQGQFAVQDDQLFVPGGRTPPAVFNRHTGDLMFYHVATHSTRKGSGGHSVFPRDGWYFNVRDYRATHMYTKVDGAQFGSVNVDLTTENAFIGANPSQERITAYATELDRIEGEQPPEPQIDRYGRPLIEGTPDASSRAPGVTDRLSSRVLSDYYELRELWTSEKIDGLRRLHLKAGSTFYGSGKNGRIFAITMPDDKSAPELEWSTTVDGEIFSMIAAHNRLFVITEDGRIFCFGEGARETVVHQYDPDSLETKDDHWTEKTRELLDNLDTRGEYAVMFGIGSGRLLDELLEQSDMHIAAFDPNPQKVAELKEHYTKAGLYGNRVAVHQGDAASYHLSPYIADLVVSEDPVAAGLDQGAAFVQSLFHSVRPYGGMAYIALDGDTQQNFISAVEQADLEKAELSCGENYVALTRPGALPGSASWTHQYADAGNTAFSPDTRVKAPLGVSFFGSEPNYKALPRHMNGPIPQVVNGRLILLGPHHVSARCVYTGVELWAKKLRKVGERFTNEEEADYETYKNIHFDPPGNYPNQPGANFIGSPYASAQDGVYVIHEKNCLHLDMETGEILNVFEMPEWEELKQHGRDPFTQDMTESYGARLEEGEQIKWGNIRYLGDYLIAAAYPHMFDDRTPGRDSNWNATSSEFIVVMNRYSGEIKWVHQARYGFRHNAIVAGDNKVFVIDHLSNEIMEMLNRRGIEPDIEPEIRALDLHSGDMLWTYDEEVFGTALAYSKPQDILLQSGHVGRRRALPDEPRDQLLVLQGETGEMLWNKSHRQRRSPLGMHASMEQIILSTAEGALCMFTGEPLEHQHPMTDESEKWYWLGGLRCGTQNFSEHLITFRSGAGGFTDLSGGAMSGNLTGFRPGCTNNLIVADGMLNSPDYTRSCACSYQNQTSIGFVHMPDSEMWTYSSLSSPEPGTIKRAGINFAAPGNRLETEKDVLWVEYPTLVGPAPEIPVEISYNEEESLYRNHVSWIENSDDEYPWVASYGIKDVDYVDIKLNSPETGTNHNYDVTLYFSEPENIDIGERVFDIQIQGEKYLENIDIVELAGGPKRVYSVELKHIPVQDNLELDFLRHDGSLPPVLSGVRIILSE